MICLVKVFFLWLWPNTSFPVYRLTQLLGFEPSFHRQVGTGGWLSLQSEYSFSTIFAIMRHVQALDCTIIPHWGGRQCPLLPSHGKFLRTSSLDGTILAVIFQGLVVHWGPSSGWTWSVLPIRLVRVFLSSAEYTYCRAPALPVLVCHSTWSTRGALPLVSFRNRMFFFYFLLSLLWFNDDRFFDTPHEVSSHFVIYSVILVRSFLS